MSKNRRDVWDCSVDQASMRDSSPIGPENKLSWPMGIDRTAPVISIHSINHYCRTPASNMGNTHRCGSMAALAKGYYGRSN